VVDRGDMIELPALRCLGPALCREAIDKLAADAGATAVEHGIVRTLHDVFHSFSEWSAEHSIRVGLHVAGFAAVLGHAPRDAARMGLSCCLHDIGKIAIPRGILDKPGRLDAQERELVEAHVLEGLTCVDYMSSICAEFSADAIRFHHENQDGSGYPHGLKGEDLPEIARMARICDVFDALRFDRPYRPGLSRVEAFAVMERQRMHFDPALYEVFFREISRVDHLSKLIDSHTKGR